MKAFFIASQTAIKTIRYVHRAKFPPRSVHLDARQNHAQNVI